MPVEIGVPDGSKINCVLLTKILSDVVAKIVADLIFKKGCKLVIFQKLKRQISKN